jgi:serine protease Do
MSDVLLHPYPMPDAIGLRLDSTQRATVKAVAPGSIAAKAGFKAGDKITKISAQPIISIADVQWMLERSGESAALTWEITRNGKSSALRVVLPIGWRKASPFAWRVTSWDLRRMGFGGMKLEDMTNEERKSHGLSKNQLALQAKHVGQWGEHALAKKAGVKKGDIIIDFDGVTLRATEGQALAHVMKKRMKGDTLPITVQRGRQKLSFKIRMQ